MRLEDEVHQNLKLKTIQDGVSIQGFIKEVVETYLNRNMTAIELLEKIKK